MKRISRLLLTIGFVLLLLIAPQKVYAAEGSGEDDDGGPGTQTVVGGPAANNTGWLVYIVDDKMQQLSETKVFYSSDARPPANAITYPKTKGGGSSNGYLSDGVAEWIPKPPFGTMGEGHGSEIKSYMLGDKILIDFIVQYFGEHWIESMTKEKMFLIMEPFYWGQLYNGSQPTGRYVCATAHGWADYQNRLGLGDTGSYLVRRYTNNIFANCVRLEFNPFSIPVPIYSGVLTNRQIMESGNGYMAFWLLDGLELPEDSLVKEEMRQTYAIKNWSEEFDISEGIPSGELVKNAYEADSFFGSTTLKTEHSIPEIYSVTYTYQTITPVYEIKRDPITGDPIINPDTGKEEEVFVRNDIQTVATRNVVFSARVAYQILDKVEVYAFDNLKTHNDAFPFPTEYTKENSYEWHDVTPDIIRYAADGDYSNVGLLECKDVYESHYYLPESSILTDQTFIVGSTQEAYNRMGGDIQAAKQKVFNASWSRNDRLVIKAGTMTYPFMTDTQVTGCIISDFSDASAATSEYRYGGMGIQMDSVEPLRSKGEMEVQIPASTDNLSYPTGVTAIYKNIANTEHEQTVVLRAGKGIFTEGLVDDIYKHIIQSDNSYGQDHDRKDVPEGDGYDIQIHTPVISPIMITSYLGTPQWYPDEQLIDVDEDAEFQLKLDGSYMVRWNLDQWISFKFGELMGYEENGGFPSRYDEYVEKKEIKFPFDVYYDDIFYDAGTWITLKEPSDHESVWDDGLSLEDKSEYKSNNHWQMTPIYIPSYAEEGSGTIEARVHAHNVEGRYEGSHNVVEAMELTMNTEMTSYIATYEITEQLSGHIYGFTVTGVDDKDMYDILDIDKTVWDRIGYSLCPTKEEKVPGVKNRFGLDSIRHLVDGTLSSFVQQPDGTYEPNQNLLPLREGSNESAGIHTGDGRLWLGTGFGFQVKTIANLWDCDDYIEITPTFKFYTKDGRLVDTIYMENGVPKSTNNRLIVFYKNGPNIEYFFDLSGQKNYTVAMGNPYFEYSFYDENTSLEAGGITRRYGDWVNYTLNRWNTNNRLYGSAAKTRYDMMDAKWPCYTNTLITLDCNLRMLSGEWDQLFKNRNRQGTNVATYYDFNEDLVFDEGTPSDMETLFRDSMQTWFGGYCMPGYMLIYDNVNDTFREGKGITLGECTIQFEVVINFDIIAYKDGVPHLSYGGYINGGRVWDKEGYQTDPGDPDGEDEHPPIDDPNGPYDGPFDYGDVVIYDMTKAFSDKFEGQLINVN